MYGIAGERRLPEFEIEWLPGYENSRPVRIGNAAHQQLQLDVYGELSDALYTCRRYGLESNPYSWQLILKLLEYLETIWQQPDCGMWESRGEPRHFLRYRTRVVDQWQPAHAVGLAMALPIAAR